MVNEKPMLPVDMQRAVFDPGAVFATPEEVVSHTGLMQDQKIEILQRWEYDAAEVAVAVEEGMPGDDNDLLGRILLALEALGGLADGEYTGPTKQHGLSKTKKKQL